MGKARKHYSKRQNARKKRDKNKERRSNQSLSRIEERYNMSVARGRDVSDGGSLLDCDRHIW